ncbi:MAG: small multi-drug export protein [Candidatus Omnitrophica bacterium]|nr:small multi-drug export protein [Candidatus Omnitrophota bacterium]
MNEAIMNFFKDLPPEWLVVLLSALPISEVRGSIPVGIMMHMHPLKVFLLSIFGNILPILPLLYLLEPVSEKMRKFSLLKKFFDWLFEHAKKKSEVIEKYELLGLMIFIAIPLPMTGAWTGCVAASLLKLDKKLSFLAAVAGVMIAAVIVMILTIGVKGCFMYVR